MPNLKKLLSTDDISTIDATAATNWVPKDPAEVILPYVVTQQTNQEEDNIETRLQKAQQVVDNYTEVINKCRELEVQIEERCQAVVVSIDKSNQKSVKDAMGRIFGFETDEITFEQYKICIQELAKLNNSTVPSPENL